MSNAIPADFGIETFSVGNQSVRGDVYVMGSDVSGVYAQVAEAGVLQRTDALNAVFAKYGLAEPLHPAAADKLAAMIVEYGIDLKKNVWRETPNGPSEPESPGTTPA